MPELRQDPLSREWIVIAKERAKRPHEMKKKREIEHRPPHDGACPFCEGNEGMTPPEKFAFRQNLPNTPGWLVRVVPNKFAALVPRGDLTRRHQEGFFRSTDGVGHHEVIIETPRHDLDFATMDDDQVERVIFAYRQRYRELRQDPRVEDIIIFCNHGLAAGTSLIHGHSQLIATPVVPNLIRERLESSINYYDDTGRRLLSDILDKELEVGSRIADQYADFVAFHPFAPRQPFETWIMSHKAQSSFGNISDDECRQFAHIMKRALYRLYIGLNDPDFNFVIHTAPVRDENQQYYAWHLQILPRISTPAGFEIGSGMSINTSLPEETAEFMRSIEVPETAAAT
ncbi:MAG TPA: galactose-1-phosphate uridylyltransferase [Planctomycetota bacterium]|nr:galactose-1-phosphate uridylyltransferase [Planctomycetota bacterium]